MLVYDNEFELSKTMSLLDSKKPKNELLNTSLKNDTKKLKNLN